MAGKMLTVLGLMSGTSMDGVDAAVIETDGETVGASGPRLFRPYSPDDRRLFRQVLAEARSIRNRDDRRGAIAEAERVVTEAHGDVVKRLLSANRRTSVDLIGFHGQTVFHAPEKRLTVQIGNASALARSAGIRVAYDFRGADVRAGGQGAPLVPVYHRALVQRSRLPGDIAIVNIGGVANLTRVGADGSLFAGDTGPGNALIDDLVQARTGEPLDRGGKLAAAGRVDQGALAELLTDPWFDLPFPKSLDRNAFSLEPVAGLSTEDGAATLAAFTARTIARGIAMAGGAGRVVVAGGGAHNPVLLRMIAEAAGTPVVTAADLGWSIDFLEAEAFAFLAARSLAGLPLSYPETTGVPMPMPGGLIAEP